MKIYTRQGDQGETQLLGAVRTSKLDARIAACGVIDEVNACLGLAAAEPRLPADVADGLDRIQAELFQLGAWIASVGTPRAGARAPAGGLFGRSATERLEREIDQFENHLEPLRNFIIPGGHAGAAALQLSRAVCRRAELKLLELKQAFDDEGFQIVLPWINRFSDWLFVAARRVNQANQVTEPIWKAPT